MKCPFRAASPICKASSGGQRRNPDFSKQNRRGFSRNRNRQNEDRDSFENLDESDLLASKNGPLLSISSNPKSQATAAPGPREKEIVELFRKVQAQLRERAAVKEDKKVEASRGKGKENETVDSLLKLLRKHSVEQGKKKVSSVSSGDLDRDQSEQNGPYNEDKTTSLFAPNNKERNGIPQPNTSSFTRPPSNFRRRSPVPQVKFQSVYPTEDSSSSMSNLVLTGERKKFETLSDPVQQPQLEPEVEPYEEPQLESELETEPLASFPGTAGIIEEFSEEEEEGSDTDITYEDGDKQQLVEHEDLSSLIVPELKAIAKSRGFKGFSKMKKAELVELLTSGSV